MIQLVIFDMDGTTFNTIGALANSANVVFESHGYQKLGLDFYTKAVGGGISKFIKKSMAELSMDCTKYEAVLKEFVEHYSRHFDYDLYMYEGIRDLIEKLNDTGKIVTINTNKKHTIAQDIIVRFFNNDEIKAVIGQQEKYGNKPDPSGAYELMGLYKVSPEETIYIGDSGVDVETAKNAGIKCVGVTWGFGVKADVELADYIANSAKEIEGIILGE